jgi:hypothetical protein
MTNPKINPFKSKVNDHKFGSFPKHKEEDLENIEENEDLEERTISK